MKLIDADKLILHLNNYALQEAPFGHNDGEHQKEIYETIKECMKAVEEQPTAYDVQKVLDELERKIEFAGKMMVEKPSDKLDEIANNVAEDFILAYSEAIEIVKRGGIHADD